MSEQIDRRFDAGLATAFDMGPVILTITRLADGRFVEVNERFLAATGYTREEVLGRTPLDLGLWINPEQRSEGLKRLREGLPVREVEAGFRMKSGEVRTCLMSADLIELRGDLCALTALTDITERKHAEAVLTRYHLLSERTREIMLFLRPDGQIVEANAAAIASYGYDRATLLAKNIRDLCDPSTAADFVAQLSHVDAGGRLFTTIHRRNDRSTFPVEVSLSGADLSGEHLLLSIIRDITEQKQAEAALRASQDRLSGIVTSAMDAIITVDAEQRIVLFNRAAEQMFGYTADELAGQPLDRIIPQRFRTAHQRHIARFGQTGVTNRGMGGLGAISGLRAGGSEFPIEAAISQVEAAGQKLYTVILRDITARRQAEAERAELLEREHAARIAAEHAAGRVARLQAITAALSQALTSAQVAAIAVEHGIAAFGAQQGLAALLTPDSTHLEILQFVGYPPEVLETWRPIAIDGPTALARAVRTQLLVTSEPAEDDDSNDARRSGTQVAIPLIVEGRALGVLGLSFAQSRSFDPDDHGLLWALAQQCAQAFHRTQLYDAERQARSAAEAAVHIRDTFLTTAAHELKTPLTVLLGNVQLLQRRLDGTASLTERDERLLRIIGEQAGRLNRLIAVMLDISRLQTEQLTITRAPLDIAALVRRVVEDVWPTLTHHTLTCSLLDAPLIIEGDELRLEQVLQNLLSNAMKYSPAGGPITVRVERQNGEVSVAVADQGIGIPQANLPKLFQRFYRADNVDPRHISGMGIGLYLVRAIVELHGGRVEVVSPEEGGSIFTVYLPEAQA